MCAMICQDVCCMCAMICQDLCVCQYVCHPIAVSVPKPQESRKSARIQEKCQNPRNPRNPTKSTKSDEIPGIQQNRPFIIDHFIRHFTLQMTGQVGDRFWDFGVRLPTKQSFLTRQNRLTREFRISGVGAVAERLFPKKKGSEQE